MIIYDMRAEPLICAVCLDFAIIYLGQPRPLSIHFVSTSRVLLDCGHGYRDNDMSNLSDFDLCYATL